MDGDVGNAEMVDKHFCYAILLRFKGDWMFMETSEEDVTGGEKQRSDFFLKLRYAKKFLGHHCK